MGDQAAGCSGRHTTSTSLARDLESVCVRLSERSATCVRGAVESGEAQESCVCGEDVGGGLRGDGSDVLWRSWCIPRKLVVRQ